VLLVLSETQRQVYQPPDPEQVPKLVESLCQFAQSRPVPNRYFRELAEVSIATATNDLAKLQAAGLLASTGRGRSTEYRGTEALLERVATEARLPTWQRSTGEPLDQRRHALVAALAGLVRASPTRDGQND